jgi:hypothetical protein
MWTRLKKWWRLEKPFALPSRLFPNEPGEYTWEDWREENKKAHPFRFFVQETLPLKVSYTVAPVKKFFYWFRSNTYNRYHMLDMRDKANGYKWGYCDPTGMMLYANFKILNMFVEHDMPNICYYSEATEGCPEWDKRAEEKEILELHKWWNEERPIEIQDVNYFHPKPEDVEDWATWRSKDDIMLERLIKIRMSLWS